MHTTMVPVQVKTMKIQAGVQVSRPGELRRHLQLWKRFGRQSNREGPEEAKGAKAGLSFTIMLVNAKIHSVGTPLSSPEVKNVLKRSRWETTIHQAGGSGDGTGSKPGVPNEPKGKSIDTNEWTSL
ncbi:hypothetical protein Tco_0353416 [Tanacetum coccineum]